MLFSVLLVVFVGCKGLLCNAEEVIADNVLSTASDSGIGRPEIINHVSVYEVEVEETLEIECKTTGNPKPDYKWFKELKDISNRNRFTVFPENGRLRVNNVEEADRGVYTCIASNSFGSGTHDFSIKVLQKPFITEFENISIAVDTEANLICKAKGRPAPLITFRRYGWEFVKSEYGLYSDVIPSQVVDEELGETIGTLSFRALSWYDGNYECLAKNKVDSVIQTTYVTIEFPPNLGYTENPQTAYSYRGRPVNFTCIARAIPAANIDWYWNDQLMNYLDDQNFSVVKSGSESTLVIQPVDDSYFTTYKCVASNKLGQANRTMEIRVAYPPEAIADVMARSWSTNNIYFEVKASLTGTPPQFYKYEYKEEAEIDWIESINRTTAVSPLTTVSVEDLKQNTNYNFRFYAANELGISPFREISHKTMCQYNFLNEIKLLNKITEDRADGEIPFIESPYTDKIELFWEAIIEPCEETILYTIEYRLALHSNWKSIGVYAEPRSYVEGVTNTNYVIGNLTAETYYAVRIMSRFSILNSYHFIRTARDPVTGGDARLKIYPTYSVQALAVGTSFNFTCKTKAEYLTNLSWRDSFNNLIDAKSSDAIMYTEVVNDGIMLVVPFVKHAMYGTYYCAASNDSDIIETFVKIDPYILQSGTEKFDYRLGYASRVGIGYVGCRFYGDDGTDNATIKWFFENNSIQPSDRYEFRPDKHEGFPPEYNLIIQNITDADEGFYTCRQSLNERQIYLEVVIGPSIWNLETEYSAVEGNDVVIDCRTKGKPAPNVKWVNGSEEDVTLNNRYSESRQGQMKITKVKESDKGNYTCKADSMAGMAEKTFQLNVESN